MSIIVMGIDLPKNKDEYKIIRIYGNGRTWADKTLVGQAIQIPTPHGRLIDGDALELEKEVELADDWKTAHEIANCVKYAPTILEEEK